jgi:hypothetical protein
MRRGSKPALIYDEVRKGADGNPLLLGVNLSSDFCAEHEWGIKDTKEALGIPGDVPGIYGLKRRQITRRPEGLMWTKFTSKYFVSSWDVERGIAKKKGNVTLHNEGFVFHDWYYREPDKLALNSELSGVGLRGAWSEDDFAAISSKSEEIVALKEIFAEFEKLNIALCFSGALPVFDNPGLVFAIADRLPQTVLEDWDKYDRDQEQIKKEFAATGIEKLLKETGKTYYALSPRRREDGSLWYWLNPMEQQKNNYGWFVLEDLQAWARDEGPIPMKQK